MNVVRGVHINSVKYIIFIICVILMTFGNYNLCLVVGVGDFNFTAIIRYNVQYDHPILQLYYHVTFLI